MRIKCDSISESKRRWLAPETDFCRCGANASQMDDGPLAALCEKLRPLRALRMNGASSSRSRPCATELGPRDAECYKGPWVTGSAGEPMRCQSCTAENPEDAKFCGECASPIIARCTRCGADNRTGAKFCNE